MFVGEYNMKDLQKMQLEFESGIEMMWEADKLIGHKWVLPSPVVCLMYSITECSESINSLTSVMDGQEHYRNNPKDRNTQEEICDTIMMLGRYCMAGNKTIFDESLDQDEMDWALNGIESSVLDKNEKLDVNGNYADVERIYNGICSSGRFQ
jgi:hypothetical protein